MNPPTFERFLADHYHELFGLICDAALGGLKGAELSMSLKVAQNKLRQRMKSIYEDLTPKASDERSPRPDVPVQGPHRKPDGKVSVP